MSDGDTITVETERGREKIRMNRIDAPESSQKYGAESRNYLASCILDKEVKVEFTQRDKYGRILGIVYLGKEDVNLLMIRKGWAWHYIQYSQDEQYAAAEKAAKRENIGLWQQEKPLPPWIFRHPERAENKAEVAVQAGKTDVTNCKYWISNSGKTHNQNCKMFYGNSGSGRYSNTPGKTDAKCCGGARR